MISVDTVYQRVLAILNKENRGYMTPQEFNLLANQAQLEVFEQYFYDLSQFNRAGGVTNEYADIVSWSGSSAIGSCSQAACSVTDGPNHLAIVH